MFKLRAQNSSFCLCIYFILSFCLGNITSAVTEDSLTLLATKNVDKRIEVLFDLSKSGDPELENVLDLYRQGQLVIFNEKLYRIGEKLDSDLTFYNGNLARVRELDYLDEETDLWFAEEISENVDYDSDMLYLYNGALVLCYEFEDDDDYNEIAPLLDPWTEEPLLDDNGDQLMPLAEDLVDEVALFFEPDMDSQKPLLGEDLKGMLAPLSDVKTGLCSILDVLTSEPIRNEDNELLYVELKKLDRIEPNFSERQKIQRAVLLLKLFSPDESIRYNAVRGAGDMPDNAVMLPFLEEISNTDSSEKIRFLAKESRFLIQLSEWDKMTTNAQRVKVLDGLDAISCLRAIPRLKDMIKALDQEEFPLLYDKLNVILDSIQSHQTFVDTSGNLFQGISLGSILILMALGLAITFGLMGVINMAHGELMMLGAYATYCIQQLFVNYLPESLFNWYYVLAFPVSFLAAALMGLIIEKLVVQHLYKRPLESLLATWGVSFILIQGYRMIFGDNVGVNSPTWFVGGAEIFQDLILPYNRVFIIFLTLLCVAGTWLLFNKTKLGLMIRATMQNREMASSLGINIRRLDGYTFAFGSGLAGLAGYALTLVGGVRPDMGQAYIVDSFLVVVTGGVGEIIGTICSGLGLGILNKFFEGLSFGDFEVGAVWAKVILLFCVIIFIQFKPAGLFPPKGRFAND